MLAPHEHSAAIARVRSGPVHHHTHHRSIFTFRIGDEPSLYEEGFVVKCDLVAEEQRFGNPITPAYGWDLHGEIPRMECLKHDFDFDGTGD